MTAIILDTLRHNADGSVEAGTITVDPDAPENIVLMEAASVRRAARQNQRQPIDPAVQRLTDALIAKGVLTDAEGTAVLTPAIVSP